ncbi:hypothetical protein [Winogradskyella sp. SYSU M77433]|uniref:hypothetical protein n=1 Tax=Winogradskyella sp. SYSU M77433 TaxID=3042722 RepID=UPI0024809D9D|nr:hypothetical protein [Winogradskyella sp. SYSU M77433]MDH7913217.1 hypothetical protein [Winogradskyella sp. SYSU M77433]
MNPLFKLIPELEDFLKSVRESMIYDLVFFIKRESSNPKLRMLSFIYSFEDFKTIVYSLDNKGETITDVVGLPIKDYENLYSMENYGRFVPYELEEKEDKIYKQYQELEDKDKLTEYWDYSEEYQSMKSDIFKSWFMDCWQVASTNTNAGILACLAIHDSSGGIELTTGKYMTDDEIENIFD